MNAMRRLLRRTAPFTAVRRPATRALGASAAVVLLLAGTAAMRPAPTGVTTAAGAASASAVGRRHHQRQLPQDHLAGPARDRAVRPVRAAAGQAGRRGRGAPGGVRRRCRDQARRPPGERPRREPGAVPVLDPAGHRDGSASVDGARAGPLRDLAHAGRAAEAAPGHGLPDHRGPPGAADLRRIGVAGHLGYRRAGQQQGLSPARPGARGAGPDQRARGRYGQADQGGAPDHRASPPP